MFGRCFFRAIIGASLISPSTYEALNREDRRHQPHPAHGPMARHPCHLSLVVYHFLHITLRCNSLHSLPQWFGCWRRWRSRKASTVRMMVLLAIVFSSSRARDPLSYPIPSSESTGSSSITLSSFSRDIHVCAASTRACVGGAPCLKTSP